MKGGKIMVDKNMEGRGGRMMMKMMSVRRGRKERGKRGRNRVMVIIERRRGMMIVGVKVGIVIRKRIRNMGRRRRNMVERVGNRIRGVVLIEMTSSQVFPPLSV